MLHLNLASPKELNTSQIAQINALVRALLTQRPRWSERQQPPGQRHDAATGAGPSNAPAPPPIDYRQAVAGQFHHPQMGSSHGNTYEVSPNRRLPVPAKFHGRTDTHISCTQTWFDSLVQYMKMTGSAPSEHFVFWLTGRAQEWGQALLKLYADKGEHLTLPLLRAAFLLQYGDIRRHTEQEVHDQLFAGDHNMKTGERVQEYTQRFRDIIRDARDMSQGEMISWYVHGLPTQLRKACGTDANGRDRPQLDALIEFVQGQDVRSRVAALKTASLNFVKTPRDKILKRQARPWKPITCRDCNLTVKDLQAHKSSGQCERFQQLTEKDAPLPRHNEYGGRGREGRGRGWRGNQGGRGAGGDAMQR